MADFEYTASGGLSFGGSSPAVSPSWRWTGSGTLNLGSSATTTIVVYVSGSGETVLGSGATAHLVFSYIGSGGLGIGNTAPFEVTYNFDETFTWDISVGVLRNWRVEGKCEPANHPCPPTSNPDTGCANATMQFMMNVQAHSLTDLCNKLKNKSWLAPVKKIQVWSLPVNKSDWSSSDNVSCNRLSLVDFAKVPDCIDFTVDQTLSVTGKISSGILFERVYEYTASGGLNSGGSVTTTSSSWSYTGSGNLSIGGDSIVSSPQYYLYVGSGGLSSYTITREYDELSTTGVVSSDVLDLDVIFGYDSATTLTASTEEIEATCCTELNLPQILSVRHSLNRSEELSNFLRVNGFTLPQIVSMMFSRSRNSWHSNSQFRGLAVDQTEDEIWNIIFEFGCLTENAILGIPSDVWGFSILMRRRGLSSGKIDITRLLLEFDPNEICNAPGELKFDFTFNTSLQTTSPSVVRTVVFLDELNSFNGVSYRRNPLASFEVSATTPAIGAGMYDQSVPFQKASSGI